MLKMSLFFAAVFTGFFAQALTPMVDGISDDQIYQVVEIAGQEGYTTKAAILNAVEDTEQSLVIIQTQGVQNYLIEDVTSLGLVTGGMAGTESILNVTEKGSLQIVTQNLSVGRDRWERTLTVAYRNGKYKVVGFTYSYYDSLQEFEPENCDYNLLTGKGVNAGKAVKVSTKAINLGDLDAFDATKLYSCYGW